MLQLPLNFLARQLDRLKSPPVRETRQNQSFAWKHDLTVHLVFQPRARRYLLRFKPDGTARLVIPRRGSRAEGLRFLDRSEAWLLQRLNQWRARGPISSTWTEGSRFLFRGEEVTIRLETKSGTQRLLFADQHIPLTRATSDYRPLILNHLRRMAERELPVRTRELAKIHGITVHRITVRAQKTRWGSCSVRGTISLNWRLIQAPSSVIDYLIIHELMHRREMNHSTRYWKLVADACPGYQAAERWLKKIRLEELA